MNASEDATNLSNMLHGPHSCVPLVLRLAKRQSRAASGKAERVKFVFEKSAASLVQVIDYRTRTSETLINE